MKDVVVIYGPTAVGKSAIAIELAKMLNGEIVSADSMQVYKKLDIGTAKVTKDEMQGILHHLIDIKNAGEEYSVSEFCDLAIKAIEDIIKRNKTPIVVGGTGLYIKALIDGYNFSGIEKNEKFRESLKSLTNDEIYNLICKNNNACNLDKANRQRLIRAYEKIYFGGKIENLKPDFNFMLFVIVDDRQKIYERINNRVDNMVKDGILNELDYLLSLKLPKDNLCMKAIGYKEFFEYIDGVKSLDECKNLLKQKTRNYAKRQFTFLNQFENKIIIDYCGLKQTTNKIFDMVKNNGQ